MFGVRVHVCMSCIRGCVYKFDCVCECVSFVDSFLYVVHIFETLLGAIAVVAFHCYAMC